MTFIIGGTTGAMLAGTLITTAGGLAGQAISRGKGGGPMPQAQLAPDEKSGGALQPTAKGFMQPMTPPAQPQANVAGLDPNQIKSLLAPPVPQDALLGDYLRKQQQGY